MIMRSKRALYIENERERKKNYYNEIFAQRYEYKNIIKLLTRQRKKEKKTISNSYNRPYSSSSNSSIFETTYLCFSCNSFSLLLSTPHINHNIRIYYNFKFYFNRRNKNLYTMYVYIQLFITFTLCFFMFLYVFHFSCQVSIYVTIYPNLVVDIELVSFKNSILLLLFLFFKDFSNIFSVTFFPLVLLMLLLMFD